MLHRNNIRHDTAPGEYIETPGEVFLRYVTPATIPYRWVDAFCRRAHLDRTGSEPLLRRCGIEPSDLPSAPPVSVVSWLTLHLDTAVTIGDELMGLAGRPLRRGAIEMMLHLVLGSRNLLDAFQSVERILAMIDCPSLKTMRISGDDAVFVCHCPGADDVAGAIGEDISLNFLYSVGSWAVGRALPVSAVTIRAHDHPDIGGHHWGIAAPVALGTTTSFTLPKRELLAPIRAKPSGTLVADWVTSYIDRLHANRAVARSRHVPGRADVHLADIARADGISVSSVQRRLREDGNGFRATRQWALCNRAFHLLRATDASVDSIAFELGYADARTFRRFFKAATGLTPSDARDGGMLDAPVTLAREREIGLAVASRL